MKTTLLVLATIFATVTAPAAEKFKPLWDGKTFTGWRLIGNGQWTIEDGSIRGRNVKSEQEFGHIVSDRTSSRGRSRDLERWASPG